LREESRLWRIFWPKRDEGTGDWRKLHNEELNDLHYSSKVIPVIKSRGMRWAEHVVRMGEKRGAYRAVVGKPEGERQPGRTRRKWEDVLKMDLQLVRCRGMDWIDLDQNRDRWRGLVNAVMNLRFP